MKKFPRAGETNKVDKVQAGCTNKICGAKWDKWVQAKLRSMPKSWEYIMGQRKRSNQQLVNMGCPR